MVVERGLSEGQKQCLRLVAQGLSSKEIAQETGLSPSTVDTYVKGAMARLGVSNRREAARILMIEEQSQELGSPKEALVDSAFSQQVDDIRATGLTENAQEGSYLPPIGGSEQHLDWSRKTIVILQIAGLSAAVFVTLALLFAGILLFLR